MKIDLRADRLNRGLSAEEMAKKIGVKPHVLRYVEKTGNRPLPSNAFKIARFYGVSVTDMWPEDEREPALSPGGTS